MKMNLLPRATSAVIGGGRSRLLSSASIVVATGGGGDLSRWNSGHGHEVEWVRRRQPQRPQQWRRRHHHRHTPHQYVNNWRSFSSTSASTHSSNRDELDHHRHRSKLQIGLEAATAAGSASHGDGVMGNAVPRITALLTTAIQNGIRQFDIPFSFEEYKNMNDDEGRINDASSASSIVGAGGGVGEGSGAGVGSKCWHANRKSEQHVASAFQLALDTVSYKEEKESELTSTMMHGEHKDVVTLTSRLGYRSAIILNHNDATTTIDEIEDDNNIDLQEKEGKFMGDAKVGIQSSNSSSPSSSPLPSVAIVHNLSSEYVLHSLRTSPLVQWRQQLSSSLSSKGSGSSKIRLISLAHNPDTRIAAYLIQHQQQTGANNVNNSTLLHQARSHMKQTLTSAFIGYERAVKDGLIDGYGVDSNGLSLPSHHTMHLCWIAVLECAVDAYVQVYGDHNGNSGGINTDDAGSTSISGRSSLKIIRLPGNLLETRGLDVADKIRSFFRSGRIENDDGNAANTTEDDRLQKLQQYRHLLPTSVDVYVTRPTTAYPHGGGTTGSGSHGVDGKHVDAKHPVLIQDYQIIEDVETSSGAGTSPTPLMTWTNEYYNKYGLRPTSYQSILNATLSHFDADSILEASQSRQLTVEERETLDGCKLLRDMIHDLDVSVDDMKSFAAYEEYLMNVAVPLIYGSFEGLDEESASRLQDFLRVHGMAARLAVARWTRELLLAGWRSRRKNADNYDSVWEKNTVEEEKMSRVWKSLGFGNDNNNPNRQLGYKVPEDIKLQEFAIRQLLENISLSGVVVDCSSPEEVLEVLSWSAPPKML